MASFVEISDLYSVFSSFCQSHGLVCAHEKSSLPIAPCLRIGSISKASTKQPSGGIWPSGFIYCHEALIGSIGWPILIVRRICPSASFW